MSRPSTAAASAERRRLRRGPEPYRQGDLDGLCGVYAVVNAVSALCPELTEPQAKLLFRKLIRSLAECVPRPLASVCSGVDDTTMWRLLDIAQKDARKRLSVKLRVTRFAEPPESLSLPQFWGMLETNLIADQVAVIGVSGSFEHWTVVYDMSPRLMTLIDSDDLRALPRSSVTMRKTKTRYRLEPSELVFLQRVA